MAGRAISWVAAAAAAAGEAAAELRANLGRRGELLAATSDASTNVADACREFRDRARAERRKAEKARAGRWF